MGVFYVGISHSGGLILESRDLSSCLAGRHALRRSRVRWGQALRPTYTHEAVQHLVALGVLKFVISQIQAELSLSWRTYHSKGVGSASSGPAHQGLTPPSGFVNFRLPRTVTASTR
eukprot:EG_transcript_52451